MDAHSGKREFFGCVVVGDVINRWKAEGKEQVICQAELLAVPIALWVWRRTLEQRNAIVFVDNEPAKDALVRGISSSNASSAMVRDTRILCAGLAIGPWFARVTSPSNLADGPSRADDSVLVALGSRRIVASVPTCFDDVVLREF